MVIPIWIVSIYSYLSYNEVQKANKYGDHIINEASDFNIFDADEHNDNDSDLLVSCLTASVRVTV